MSRSNEAVASLSRMQFLQVREALEHVFAALAQSFYHATPEEQVKTFQLSTCAASCSSGFLKEIRKQDFWFRV